MYVTFDLMSPVTTGNMKARRFKSDFFRLWPTTIVSATEVMDKVVFWEGTAVDTKLNRDIYKLLGTTVDEINGEDYEGIDKAYFELVPWIIDEVYTAGTVQAVIDRYATTLERHFELKGQSMKFYRTKKEFHSSTKQLEVLNEALANSEHYGLQYDTKFGDEFLALRDVDNEVYDVRITINGGGSMLSYNGTTVGYTMNPNYVSYTVWYKLKDSYNITNLTASIIELEDDKDPPHSEVSADRSDYITSMAGQKAEEYFKVTPSNSNDLFLFDYSTSDIGESVLDGSYIKTAGLKSIQPTVLLRDKANGRLEFGEAVGECVDTGFEKTGVSVYKQTLGSVLMFIAIIAMVVSAGSSSPVTVAVAGWIATAATVTLAGLSYYEANYGNVNAASMYGDSMQVVGYASAFIGIGAFINGMMQKGVTGIMAGYARMTAGELLLVTLSHANTVFGYVSQWDLKKDQKDLYGMSEALKEQESIMDKMPTPIKYAQQQWNFETYYFLEINEKMDQVPYEMTQGMIDSKMHKYY